MQSDPKQLNTLYEELRNFYQLIYIYDIQNYSIADLKSLLNRQQGSFQLDQKQKIIHEEILQKSKANVLAKKAKKQKKLQVKKLQSNKIQQKSQSHKEQMVNILLKQNQDEQDQYIQESCIIPSFYYQEDFIKLKQYKGFIIQGKYMINLPTSFNNKVKSQDILYEIYPEIDQSFINIETAKKLSLQISKQKVNIIISQFSFEIKLKNCENNVLGLDFLQKNKVLLNCDYRTENSCIQLIFTE